MATSKIQVSEGSGKNVATNSFTEDAVTKEAQRVVLNESDGSDIGIAAKLGIVTETAPGTDTASAGLNGRLQRIAQRLTALGAALPLVFGAGTAAAAQRITTASDDPLITVLGAKADPKAATTDTTPITAMSVWKQISASVQLFVFGAGTAAAAQRVTLASDDPAVAAIGAKTDAKNTATDTTSVSGISVWKQISASVQALVTALGTIVYGAGTAAAAQRVTLASDDPAVATLGAKTDAKSTATDTTSASGISVWKQISASVQALVTALGTQVFGAGTAAAAQRITLASDDPAVAALGAISGAKVITDVNGTIQQYLRGLVSQWIAGTLVLGASTNTIGTIKTRFFNAAFSTVTRPANTTAYAANDSVSDNATAGSVTAIVATLSDTNDDPVTLERLRVVSTDTGVQGKNFRAWFYNSDPTASSGVGGGDNAAFSNKRAGFIGTMSGQFSTFSDGSVAVLVPDQGTRIVAAPGSGVKTVWVQLQTLDAFTPSANSTTFISTIEGMQGRA